MDVLMLSFIVLLVLALIFIVFHFNLLKGDLDDVSYYVTVGKGLNKISRILDEIEQDRRKKKDKERKE